MITIKKKKKQNSILDSICSLSFYPSPHSHTLAGITGNATKTVHHAACSSLRGDSRHRQTRSGFSLLSRLKTRSSWIRFDFEEKPPPFFFFFKKKGFPFLSDAVQELLKSYRCTDQTNGDESKERFFKKKQSVLSMQIQISIEVFCKSVCPHVSMI